MNGLIKSILIISISFYMWVDEQVIKHFSTVPQHCIQGNIINPNCPPMTSENYQQTKRERAEVQKIAEQSIAIMGSVISVTDNGVLIGQVKLTKDIDAAFELKQDGTTTTYVDEFHDVDFNAFIVTTGQYQYVDNVLFRGVVQHSGVFEYATALGSHATVPKYISIHEIK